MNPFSYTIPQVAKAVAAGVTAGAGAFAAAFGDQHISIPEGVTIAVAVIVAAAAVFATPNADQS